MTDSELAYLQAALEWKFGYLIGLAAWQTLIRTGMVFINNHLKEFMETALPDDKQWIQSILDNKLYRVTSFLLNLAVSVKLPVEARKVGQTDFVTKKEP